MSGQHRLAHTLAELNQRVAELKRSIKNLKIHKYGNEFRYIQIYYNILLHNLLKMPKEHYIIFLFSQVYLFSVQSCCNYFQVHKFLIYIPYVACCDLDSIVLMP